MAVTTHTPPGSDPRHSPTQPPTAATTRAPSRHPTVNHAAVHRAQRLVGDQLEAERQAWIAARNAEHLAAGGYLCGILTPPGTPCGRPAIGLYRTGRCCELHTPAATAGRPEANPDPKSTLAGLRAAAGADPERPFTPAGPTAVDARAVASGKRRSTPEEFRAAQQATHQRRT